MLTNDAVRAALTVLISGTIACGASETSERADAGMRGDADAGQDAGPRELPDAGEDAGKPPETCGVTETLCRGETPVCADGVCVACSGENLGACAAYEACNAETNTCERAPNVPFALDCANLPSGGACQGGPREVLLVTQESGQVLMFDPEDGHYLGPFKLGVPSEQRAYWKANQGPDQCIWTSGQGELGIERWHPDGTFKDEVLPRGTYRDGDVDLIDAPRSIAFSADAVYVPSSRGHMSRFPLAGLPAPAGDPDPASRFRIVIDDDERVFGDVIVRADGTMIASSRILSTDDHDFQRIERRSAEGMLLDILGATFDALRRVPVQLSYLGDARLLTGDSSADTLFAVDMDTGEASATLEVRGWSGDVYGVHPLRNGRWLVTKSDQLGTVDPRTLAPEAQAEPIAVPRGRASSLFRYVGRACLANEFVAAAGMLDEPADECAAPAGEALFEAHFDDGTLGPFTQLDYALHETAFPEVAEASLVEGGASASTGALRIEYAPGFYGDSGGLVEDTTIASGVTAPIAGLAPTYIEYRVRVDAGALPSVGSAAGAFDLETEQHPSDLRNEPAESLRWIGDDQTGSIYASVGQVQASVAFGAWHRIQMRNIDWVAQRYDLYIDCERVALDVTLDATADELRSLRLFNIWPESTSYFDEIVMK